MTQKGIWVQKDLETQLIYLIFLKEKTQELESFIPFEHPYKPQYLGSISFIDLTNSNLNFSEYNLKEGLLQNKFYPLGTNPKIDRPLLIGKGLAKKIEFEVAKELNKIFSKDTPIIIGASSDSHLEYCKRIGITPWAQISLDCYTKLLAKT